MLNEGLFFLTSLEGKVTEQMDITKWKDQRMTSLELKDQEWGSRWTPEG